MSTKKHPTTPIEIIDEAYKTLVTTLRLQKGAKKGWISVNCFTATLAISSDLCMQLPTQPVNGFEDMSKRLENIVLIAISAFVTATDRALDIAFGDKDPDKRNPLNDIRAVIYMMRCAWAHDPAHPKWCISNKYKKQYKITVPREVISETSTGSISKDKTYLFDFENLHCKDVDLSIFGGIEGIIFLVHHAKNIIILHTEKEEKK